MKFRINAIAAGMALVPALAISGTAGAQMLEEVIVTAQKRSQSLGDVPISVNVVGGEMIANSGITNLNDLADFVPNLSMNQTGLGTNVTIRGISSGINPAFEQSVGMYVDDVFYGRPQLARVPYLDVDRVEVLRGPQPILFGKNAIAGAISAITVKADTEELSGFVDAEYNFDQNGYDLQGAINIPVSDTFAIRLAGLKRESDGYYENTTNGKDESELDHQIFRANFQWDATDDLSVNLKVENAQFDTVGRFTEVVSPVTDGAPGSLDYGTQLENTAAAFGQPGVVVDTKQDFKRQSNGDLEETELDNITLTVNYNMNDFTLTSVTSSVSYDYYQQCDCDFTDVVIIETAGDEDYDQFSQEFRLASPEGETVDYIVGAYYSEYDIDSPSSLILSQNSILGVPTGLSSTGNFREFTTDSEQWSVFAQATWNISDELRLTVGGRYAEEDKTGTRRLDIVNVAQAEGPFRDYESFPLNTNPVQAGTYKALFGIDSQQLITDPTVDINTRNPVDATGSPIGHNLDQKRSETMFTPAVNMQWDATEDTMVYVSYTEGFKAGGFDARSNLNTNFEFEEETAESWELGAKMSLADGAAELNVSLYRTEYADLQTSQFDGVLGFNVTNAGASTIQGIEMEGRWQATDSLFFSGALGYLDFEFDKFEDSQCFYGEVADSPNGGNLCDRSGDTREFAPELTAQLTTNYEIEVTDSMGLTLGLDLSYSDSYFVSPTLDPNLEQDAFVKVNARVQLAEIDGIWSVALMGENLTDEAVSTFGNQLPLATSALNGGASNAAYYSFYEAPRNVALKVRYNF
jgi:iron complex outermembrane receptor protein